MTNDFVFPLNFDQSRDLFLKNADYLMESTKSGELESLHIGQEKLPIDVFYLPSLKTQKKLLVINSGNHGPEGYLGAALQFYFMKNVISQVNRNDVGLVLVHALNPWGYKYHRRNNENNVNLNRNFVNNKNDFNYKNLDYAKIHHLLGPKAEVCSKFELPVLNLLWYLITKKDVSVQLLTKAIGQGQYNFEKGLNYGGSDFQQENLLIVKLLKKLSNGYEKILHLDIHSGLGKSGVLHILTNQPKNEEVSAFYNDLFRFDCDLGRYELTSTDQFGFYKSIGDYADIFNHFHESKSLNLGLTLEFGTLGDSFISKLKSLNRLILENQGHFYGYRTRKIELHVRKKFLDLFYPDCHNWRASVCSHAKYFLEVVLSRYYK